MASHEGMDLIYEMGREHVRLGGVMSIPACTPGDTDD
jgi:hypothetical protein